MPVQPLTSAKITNLGPFGEVNLKFSPQINVFVGDNGSGKTQLLKLLYSSTTVFSANNVSSVKLSKSYAERAIAEKLLGVFKPEKLGNLARRSKKRTIADVSVSAGESHVSYSFSSASSSNVSIDSYLAEPLFDTPVYFPTRELLSIFPGFISLYETRAVEFEESWRDTMLLMGYPKLKVGRQAINNDLLTADVRDLLGGEVIFANDRFYLENNALGKLEAQLMAEGERKLAMLVRLIDTGVISEGGYLFWDEPEANLNPVSQKKLVSILVSLAKNGTQIFIATHSLFLLRELQLLQGAEEFMFVGLEKSSEGVIASVETDLDDLPFVAALEAELDQNNRYLSSF